MPHFDVVTEPKVKEISDVTPQEKGWGEQTSFCVELQLHIAWQTEYGSDQHNPQTGIGAHPTSSP